MCVDYTSARRLLASNMAFGSTFLLWSDVGLVLAFRLSLGSAARLFSPSFRTSCMGFILDGAVVVHEADRLSMSPCRAW